MRNDFYREYPFFVETIEYKVLAENEKIIRRLNDMFNNDLFKWMPHKEQNVCERRLLKVMKGFKIEDFNFNWDRSSCFIEFNYEDQPYRLEHSIEKAKRKGIILKNGLDCLIELTRSLEDLSVIIDRGTYNFETWISGMKQTPSDQEVSEFQEEFYIKYKSLGEQNFFEYNKNEKLFPFESDSASTDVNRNPVTERPNTK